MMVLVVNGMDGAKHSFLQPWSLQVIDDMCKSMSAPCSESVKGFCLVGPLALEEE